MSKMNDAIKNKTEQFCEFVNISGVCKSADELNTFFTVYLLMLNDLCEQRTILLAALINAYKDKAWKSYKHEDGEYCFGGGWFIVGIDTPEGSYTYHCENKYWDTFDCIELPKAKHSDVYSETNIERLMSLKLEQKIYKHQPPEQKRGKWIKSPLGYCAVKCSACMNMFIENDDGRWNFCPHCGADMRCEKNDD